MITAKKSVLITVATIMFFLFGFTGLSTVDASSNDCKVYDYYDVLTSSEIDEINDALEKLADKAEINIAIVITDDIENKSHEAYADDFYDDLFGINTDGTVLLINYDTNTDHISTSGKCIDKMTDGDIQIIFDDVSPLIVDGDIKDACLAYVDGVEGELIYSWFGSFVVFLLIGVIIALIVGLVIASRYKLHKKFAADNYVSENETKYRENTDQFIRSYVTKTKIESSSGGGGSSTHRSSSGGTHGGGSRSR